MKLKKTKYFAISIAAQLLFGCFPNTDSNESPVSDSPVQRDQAVPYNVGSPKPIILGYTVKLDGEDKLDQNSRSTLSAGITDKGLSKSMDKFHLGADVKGPFADGSYRVTYEKSSQILSDEKILDIIEESFSNKLSEITKADGSKSNLENQITLDVKPIYLVEPYQTTDLAVPPFAYSAWHLYNEPGAIDVTEAWEKSRGENVTIAVVDTGSTDHPLLPSNTGFDFISDSYLARDGNAADSDPTDEGSWRARWDCHYYPFKKVSSFHGTHVAGLAAARQNSEIAPFSGVAPMANVTTIRALGPCGGASDDLSNAMLWAAGQKTNSVEANKVIPPAADVINLSIGSTTNKCQYIQEFNLIEKDTTSIIIAAAGNESTEVTWSSPANCTHPNVITVAAVGRDGLRADYTNWGPGIDVAAPGGNDQGRRRRSNDPNMIVAVEDDKMLSTLDIGATSTIQPSLDYTVGTSMAAPVVSGIAALAISRIKMAKGGSYTRDDRDAVLDALVKGVRPFPTVRPTNVNDHVQFCTTNTCGTGIISAKLVLEKIDTYLTQSRHTLPKSEIVLKSTQDANETKQFEYCYPRETPSEKRQDAANTSKINGKVIYGQDNRQDFYCLDTEQQVLTSSSVALVEERLVNSTNSNSILLATNTFKRSKRLCSFERFAEQKVAPFCSGALISADTVLTAAHCIKDDSAAQKTNFIFGYRISEYGASAHTKFESKQVYKGKSIVDRKLSADGTDWAVIKLDRVVDPSVATPAKLDPDLNLDPSASIFTVGYPSGLPLKLTDGASVRDLNGNQPFFEANLDTYGGNSGSPVFDENNGAIVGVLVRGEDDFVLCKKSKCYEEGTCDCSQPICKTSNICTEAGCRGEDVMKATRIGLLNGLQ